MNAWLDWREIEKHNDWGMREKTDAMGEIWDKGAAMWDKRWKSEEEFIKRQTDALEFLPTDTVLDIGCGTGPLTCNIASRVEHVIAQDYGRNMLDFVQSNAAERGFENVSTLQGNWHTMEPGVDLPICDVVITRWSPAQGDILKMSRCASRYCYSITSITPRFAEDGAAPAGFWCRSTTDESLNTTPRPCGRKYGLNVHFNLLYDHGANPTINYVEDEKVTEASTREELIDKLVRDSFPKDGKDRNGKEPKLPEFILQDISQKEDGTWEHRHHSIIAILGWNPLEIYC